MSECSKCKEYSIFTISITLREISTGHRQNYKNQTKPSKLEIKITSRQKSNYIKDILTNPSIYRVSIC
ncbi:5765_t:CDS:2 [Funneliformis mosseae]|uniref:5765_t:CDS:1 n=1 Tax=Funneliformis mosseae TaxID=27381 RepID=A0A9N9F9M5_FUNMO|nr:5765_t:CDS:2 [Funneliformis mosseae]